MYNSNNKKKNNIGKTKKRADEEEDEKTFHFVTLFTISCKNDLQAAYVILGVDAKQG